MTTLRTRMPFRRALLVVALLASVAALGAASLAPRSAIAQTAIVNHPDQLQFPALNYQPPNATEYRVNSEPAESETGLFGANSNWRGPLWFPINFLLIESLQKFHHFFRNDCDHDDFTVECPTGSGNSMNLWQVSLELSQRLINLFLRDAEGRRPAHGADQKFQDDPHWRDLLMFYEYFHADTGAGLGANHQTGWTGLVAKLIQQVYSSKRVRPTGLLDPAMLKRD